MSDEIKELISKADRGDTEAQKELMKRGDAASSAGDHEQAAFFYKMAAMAYRIKASRTGSTLSDVASQCGWFASELVMYKAWIEKYTRPLAPRINRLRRRNMASAASSCILGFRRDKDHCQKVMHLEKKLMDNGIEFCAPGGTINRHLYYMIQGRETYEGFINDIDMRVVLDPICDEILRQIY